MDKLNETDKEYVKEEFKKLLNCPYKQHLCDEYFSCSTNIPIELLQNDEILKNNFTSELNVALRNANVSSDCIQSILSLNATDFVAYNDCFFNVSYLESLKVLKTLRDMQDKEMNYFSANQLQPNYTKVRRLSELMEKIEISTTNNTSVAENINDLLDWDKYASISPSTISINFSDRFTDEDLKDLLCQLPIQQINSQADTILRFIVHLQDDPIVFNKYIEPCEHFYNILDEVVKKKFQEINKLPTQALEKNEEEQTK
jgi:hypothetical protein